MFSKWFNYTNERCPGKISGITWQSLAERVQNRREFDDFVAAHPRGHFLQTYEWSKLKVNWTWEGVIARDAAGNITGAVSLLIRKLPGLPFCVMYSARGPVCDIRDKAVLAELFEGVGQIAREYRAYILRTDPDVPVDDTEFIETYQSLGFAPPIGGDDFDGLQPRHVFRLDISGMDEDALMAFFSQKTRYNIRLAVKKGVEVRRAGSDETDALDAFARIMVETGLRDNFMVRPRAYFGRLLAVMGESARLYMAYYEGQPVAGTICVGFGDKVWYLYGASLNQHRDVMPNYLLQWEMMRWAIERGARVYDFRGVSGDLSEDNPLYGLYRFKKGFNGQLCEFAGEFVRIYRPMVNRLATISEKAYKRLMKIKFIIRHRKQVRA